MPLVYAVSLPSGMVTRGCFDEVLADFKAEAAKHPDADGIYLYLHGAMYVEGLGSGDETPYVPNLHPLHFLPITSLRFFLLAFAAGSFGVFEDGAIGKKRSSLTPRLPISQ